MRGFNAFIRPATHRTCPYEFHVTGLSEGAFVHKVQGQIFKAQGFTKLGEKYIGHYTEEMEWVEKFIDRILDLGGEV